MKTLNTFVIYFHLLFSKAEQWSPFLIPIGEMDFFFPLVLLFCAVLLVTVLFLFQKAPINNTLYLKSVYVILCCEINKCIIIVIVVKPGIIPQTKIEQNL